MTSSQPEPTVSMTPDANPFTTWSAGRLNLTVIPVWILSLVAAVVIGLASTGSARITWIGVALAGVVIATFAIQLFLQRKEGFVVRAMVSIGVSIVILAAATGIFALLE